MTDHDLDTATAETPYVPWVLSTHDLLWGTIVALLSAGMFGLTPTLAVLRKTGVVNLDWGWIFLPAILCVAAVMLHGVSELVRALLRD